MMTISKDSSITKEQENDFKRRLAGKVTTKAEREAYLKDRIQFSKKDYLAFLKSTDEKLK